MILSNFLTACTSPQSMTTTSSHLRTTFEQLNSDEIRERINQNMLTDEAQDVALAELMARGETVAEPGDAIRTPDAAVKSEPFNALRFLLRCIGGREKLWKAYWLLGTVCGLAISLPAKLLAADPSTSGTLGLYLLFVNIPFLVFSNIAIWRCAFNSSYWGWALVGRAMVILNAGMLALAIFKVTASWIAAA